MGNAIHRWWSGSDDSRAPSARSSHSVSRRVLVPDKVSSKVIIIGESGVGKTSLSNVLIRQHHYVARSTIGSSFQSKQFFIGNWTVKLQLWDTAGQERFQSLGRIFYRSCDAVLFCFDISNRRSFEMLDHWVEEFLTHQARPDVHNVVVMVVGCKADLRAKRTVTEQEAQEYCLQLRRKLSLHNSDLTTTTTTARTLAYLPDRGIRGTETTSLLLPPAASAAATTQDYSSLTVAVDWRTAFAQQYTRCCNVCYVETSAKEDYRGVYKLFDRVSGLFVEALHAADNSAYKPTQATTAAGPA